MKGKSKDIRWRGKFYAVNQIKNGKRIEREIEVKRKRQAGRQTDRQSKRETETGGQMQID